MVSILEKYEENSDIIIGDFLEFNLTGSSTIDGNLTVTGDLDVGGTTTLVDSATSGNITVGGYIQGDASGNVYVAIGSGSSSRGLSDTGDLYITGKLEVDTYVYFDCALMHVGNTTKYGNMTFYSSRYLSFYDSVNEVRLYGDITNDNFVITTNTGYSNSLIITHDDNYSKNHNITETSHPTFYIFSETDPTTDSTQWMSLSHNTNDAIINVGSGDLKFNFGGVNYAIIGSSASHFYENLFAHDSFYAYSTIYFSGSQNSYGALVRKGDEGLLFSIGSDDGSANHHLIFCSSDYYNATYGNDTKSTNPTIFLYSAKNPAVDNTQYIKFYHDQANANIACGYGNINLSPASSSLFVEVDGNFRVKSISNTIKTNKIMAVATGSTGIQGAASNTASAIGIKIGNENTLATDGAKIISFYNDGLVTEKAYIDKDGGIYCDGDSEFAGRVDFDDYVYAKSSFFVNTILPVNALTTTLNGGAVDGATAVGVKISNNNALTTDGAKIVSFYSDNKVTERAYIDKDGGIYANGKSIFNDSIGIGLNAGDTIYAKLQIGSSNGDNGGDIYCLNNASDPRFLVGESSSGGYYGCVKWDITNKDVVMYSSAYSTTSQLTLKANGDIIADSKLYAESTKRVACGGGSTGSSTTANGTVTLEINGTTYYLLTSATA